MVQRTRHQRAVGSLLEHFPVVAIIGARQVGKTTLADMIAADREDVALRLDLENPAHLARLDDPLLTLGSREGLVIVDEVQRRPELFQVLRVLADREAPRIRFLLLGSASPELLRQSSESLAGRIAYFELDGFDVDEVGVDHLDELWLRGGFPRSFLAGSEAASTEWRRQFIRTFLERDLAELGVRIPSRQLSRFWTMLAHAHGGILNASELARAFGVSDHTIRRYVDLLTSTFVVRQLAPWHENLRKRQVKRPKIYVSDSGLLHTLLGIESRDGLEGHPKVGTSWEGFAIRTVLTRLGARSEEAYFWATHAGAKLDLLVVRGTQRLGFEIKRTAAPRVTRSMRVAIEDLRLDSLTVIHAGEESFPLADGIQATALSEVLDQVAPL